MGWWAANLACEWFGRRYPDRYMRVRYEDLVGAPERTLQTIFAVLDLGPAPTRIGGDAHGNRHQLFGSRVRFKAPSLSDIQPDTRWRREMKRLDRWMISALSWPLRWRYGY